VNCACAPPQGVKKGKSPRPFDEARSGARSLEGAEQDAAVRADDKQHARLNAIRDLLWRFDYPERIGG